MENKIELSDNSFELITKELPIDVLNKVRVNLLWKK